MKFLNRSSRITAQRFIPFLKKMMVLLAIVFALQGCAVWVRDRDRDDYYRRYHRDWRHERSSVQMNQFAGNVDGKRMNADQNNSDSEHQKRV